MGFWVRKFQSFTATPERRAEVARCSAKNLAGSKCYRMTMCWWRTAARQLPHAHPVEQSEQAYQGVGGGSH